MVHRWLDIQFSHCYWLISRFWRLTYGEHPLYRRACTLQEISYINLGFTGQFWDAGWVNLLRLLIFGSFSILVRCGLVTPCLLIGFVRLGQPGYLWYFGGRVFLFQLRGTTWSLDLRSIRKTVFEHSITFIRWLTVMQILNQRAYQVPLGNQLDQGKQLQLTAAVTTVLINSK